MQPIPILFEDQDLMVINKPAGVVVNDAQTVKEETIQSWFWGQIKIQDFATAKNAPATAVATNQSTWHQLIPQDFDSQYGSPTEIFAQRQGVVHRLDKDTSGALLLAKNPGALVNLLAQFKKHQPRKKYLCLVHSKFSVQEDIISAPLGRSSASRLKFGVKIEGREAITQYKVLDFFQELDLNKLALVLARRGKTDQSSLLLEPAKALAILKKNKNSYQGFSLIECWPKTGRTHQIRVHLAHIKHPLVGDKLYLGRKRKKLDPLWCSRHFLHASQIEFIHPRTGESLQVKADLPQDLKDVLELLKK